MSSEKKYWKGIEDLNNTKEFVKLKENEFPEELPVGKFLENESLGSTSTKRRDFLKFLGFSVSAAALASCEAPVRKSIPYLVKPEDITPGIANWYASNYFDGYDYCDIIVKTREGRPIKVEGNTKSSITKGGTNARVQASVLSLYDSARLKGPVNNGKETTWEKADAEIVSKLNSVASFGGNIRILSSTIISPSTKDIIDNFKSKYKNTEHITYDAVSYSAIRKANKQSFNKAVIPVYNFADADVIVSFGADFLINWLSPVEYSAQYAANRKVSEKKNMSYHVQFETNLSVTGSNADTRYALKPSQMGAAIINLYNEIASLSGASTVEAKKSGFEKQIKPLASKLWENKGKSLVVSGVNDVNIQLFVNAINQLLNNYGSTVSLDNTDYTKQGDDEALFQLMEDMKGGKVNAIIIYNSNPAYSLPGFAEALSKVDFKVSLSDRMDETASLMTYVLPDHHYFESWNDACPRPKYYALTQPVIAPLFNTRQAADTFMKWTGMEGDYYTFIRKNWERKYYGAQSQFANFDEFWGRTLQNGILLTSSAAVEAVESKPEEKDTKPKNKKEEKPAEEVVVKISLSDAATALNKQKTSGAFEVQLYEKAGLGIGNQSNNPWLQEMPDPISKVTWDNYFTLSPQQMKDMGLNVIQGQEELSDLITLSVNGVSFTLPAVASPGQARDTVGIAFGYGRKGAGKTADNIGANAFHLVSFSDKQLGYAALEGQLSGSVGKYHIASTQTHHTMMGREIVKEATLAEYIKNPAANNDPVVLHIKEGEKLIPTPVKEVNLWQDYKNAGGHFWNMSVDLTACIGCGNCVISCQAENNVAVVGKDEVRRGREMHWMRIDRYYSSDEPKEGSLGKMEIPSENPEVVYQPVMCQHCNHASCETVCPVLATSHSTDGLNQMTYNRCVGTRYCANNCPYKVRRFNWFTYSDNKVFDFNMNDDLGKMVLNPDVVVRSRGVMEKCSLCVQRIQDVKLKAKQEGRTVKDGELQTACSQSCPTKAIRIGDINNQESEIVKLKNDKRSYCLLEEVGVQPNVFYMTKIRNKNV